MRTQVWKFQTDFCHYCVTLFRKADLRDDFEFSKMLLIWCQYVHECCALSFWAGKKCEFDRLSGKPCCVKSLNQIRLCHTFAQVRSPRWLRIFKNAFNMVSICPWMLRVKLLSGKKHTFALLSRNLAFRFRDNSIKMTLRQKKALKTCSELIEAHPS